MTKKIENTFAKALEQVETLQKVFRQDGKLESAMMESNTDVSALAEINSAFETLKQALTTSTTLTEGVLDSDDDDGFMARSQLYFMARDAIQLHGIIGDTDDLEPWVQSKIAQAAQGMDAVRRYTEYNAMKQDMPQQEELPAEMPMDMKESTLSEHSTELLAQVVDQMKQDAEMGDYTAIEELLRDVPAEELEAFLSQLDEGLGSKLGKYALAAMLGLGAVKGIDATSAKHTPLGQALDHASQTWSGEEAANALDLYKNIDLYADESSSKLRHWASQNQDLINQFKESTVDEGSYGKKKKKKYYEEAEQKPYVCVHAKKGKHECHAGSSYEAAKKAAAHWKLKSTSGIDAHLAVEEGFKIRDKSRGYGVADKTYKTREEAKKAAIMKAAETGGDWDVLEEGMEFDEKRNDDLQTVAKDLFANAKAAASKKVK